MAAFGVQGYPKFKGFSFTLVIFAATVSALYFPATFTTFQGYPLKNLIIPLLVIIMFGMGTHMSAKDFIGIIKTPKSVLVGIVCHYIIMPGIGFLLAYVSHLPAPIAAGIILVGCSPSGTASNVMAYLSGGNLPLSVTVTALSTLIAPFMTPLLMKLLAGQLVPVNFWDMLWHITQIVILPVLAGLIYNWLAHGRFQWIDKILPGISMAAIALIIMLIVAAGRDALLSIGPILILLVLIPNLVGYLLGYRLSRLVGLKEDEARTIAFEVGMQNSGLASGIALTMGRVATMGLAPAVFSSLQNITASVLATWWRNKKSTANEKMIPIRQEEVIHNHSS
jgi:BASS family bile acid:Na+ symporter